MAAAGNSPTFDTDFDPRTGEPVRVSPGIVRITAPNRGPFTFTGTNTFLLGEASLALVDPGPEDTAHLEALQRAIGGRRVDAILITHTHRDHSGLARRLKQATGAPIWFGGQHRLSRRARPFEINPVALASDMDLMPDRTLRDGETIEAGGMQIEVVATPGHCANHLCFGLAGTPWLLSGDHIMGWNTTLVPVPDGSMADYLDSLRKLMALPYPHYLPAHGGPIAEGPDFARRLLAHRQMRNSEIIRAIESGARSIGDLLGAVYPNLSLPLMPAARMTLAAHVEYLATAGRIRARRGLFGPRLSPAG